MPLQKVTKKEIIGKATEVFRLKGYHNTSMSDLAEAVGLQKGSFYHYFESKEAIMKAVLTELKNYLNERVNPVVFDESLSPRERLSRLLKSFGKTLLSKESGCIIGNITLETVAIYPDFRTIIKEIFENWIIALTHLYLSNHSEEDALKLAQQTVIEFEGAVMMSRIYQENSFIQECYQRALANLPS